MKLLSQLTSVTLLSAFAAHAEVKIHHARNAGDATARFKFDGVPMPAKNDAAAAAKFTLVDGVRDRNGGNLAQLNDGKLPTEGDQPSENFFFAQATDGGRLQIDLGRIIEIRQVNTFSWHTGTRAPQVFKLYASNGEAEGFNAEPKRDTDPEKCGWKVVASVDTRPKEGEGGGQYGASISDSGVSLGKCRYLLLDCSRTEDRDPFGNTFYSEIDVVELNGPELIVATSGNESATPITKSFTAGNGKYHFTINATAAPDLMEWADTQLRPVVQEWYPKIVEMLPSEGFNPTTNVTIRFRDNMGGTPASAGGGNINCNAGWFRRELKREALGSVVHEMVHVVQRYGGGRRNDPNSTRMPGWLVEGIPDYIRWFLYEPQTKGAEITKRNFERAKYDASYRVTGNFLNWVTEKYDTNIVVKLNAAGRQGKYNEEIWKTATGKTVQELGEEWKKAMEQKIAAADPVKPPAKEEKN
jgi:hypothetical protein